MEAEVEDDEEIDVNKLSEELQSKENIPIENLHEGPLWESNTVPGKETFLVGIRDDDNISKDTQFLEKISNVFDQNETCVKFTASRNC